MVIKDIIQLMKAAQETDFDIFELKDENFSLKLKRNGEQVVVTQAVPSVVPAAAVENTASPTEAVNAAAEVGPKTPEGKDIVSPLVGVYHELAGGKALKIGDKLKKGEPVCMVEAMKLMNEINMPEDGEIVWVAAQEGDTIEYEQLLFRYV